MTAKEFQSIQRTLDLRNHQLCKSLGVTESTLCNWKSGRIPVPNPAALAMRMLANYRHDLALWVK